MVVSRKGALPHTHDHTSLAGIGTASSHPNLARTRHYRCTAVSPHRRFRLDSGAPQHVRLKAGCRIQTTSRQTMFPTGRRVLPHAEQEARTRSAQVRSVNKLVVHDVTAAMDGKFQNIPHLNLEIMCTSR